MDAKSLSSVVMFKTNITRDCVKIQAFTVPREYFVEPIYLYMYVTVNQ